jgi:hypothetical protein
MNCAYIQYHAGAIFSIDEGTSDAGTRYSRPGTELPPSRAHRKPLGFDVRTRLLRFTHSDAGTELPGAGQPQFQYSLYKNCGLMSVDR